MATNTTNYNLVKPATTDFYDVNVFNSNFDILDAAFKGWTKYTSVTQLGLSVSTCTYADIANAMPAKSTLICRAPNTNFNSSPYNYELTVIKPEFGITDFEMNEIYNSVNGTPQSRYTAYYYNDGAGNVKWSGFNKLSLAVPKTETVIQSGFLTGFSGYVAYSVNQEGEKTVQLNMTKSSDMTTGSTTFYTLAVTTIKPKRNVYKTVHLMDGSGNYIAGCYAYVLYDTNGVLLIYVTGTVTNARNFSCVLKFD